MIKYLILGLLLAHPSLAQPAGQQQDSQRKASQDSEPPPLPANVQGRFDGLKQVALTHFHAWEDKQGYTYDMLRELKDPCNRPYIMKYMNDLKKVAQLYYDKRLEWINAYTEDRIKALTSAQTFFAATDPQLEVFKTDRANQDKLIADNREKLKSLGVGEEQERAAAELKSLIALQEDDQQKIVKNIEERQKIQKSGEIARIAFQASIDSLKEQLKLVTIEAQNTMAKYDSVISRYDLACGQMPVPDFRDEDPAAKKPAPNPPKKKQ